MAEVLRRLRERPETEIGSALLDQEALSGIGNIYKSETLFLAGVSPFSRVRELDDARLTRIVEVARELMRKNLLSKRRTTPEGRMGPRYWVYERSGEPCLRCGTRVAMKRQEPLARSTYYCAECQRAHHPPLAAQPLRR